MWILIMACMPGDSFAQYFTGRKNQEKNDTAQFHQRSLLNPSGTNNYHAPGVAPAVSLQPDIDGLCVGDTVRVPIRVSGDTIGGMDLYLDILPGVLTPCPPEFDSVFTGFDAVYHYNAPFRTIIQIINTNFSSYNFSGEKIIELLFIYNGGSTPIHLRRAPDADSLCLVFDSIGSPITPVTYSDNTINGSSITPIITGPASVCQNSTGNVYTTQSGMTNYTWDISGGTITAGSGTDAVTVKWTTTGIQSIRVNFQPPGEGQSCKTAFDVTVTPAPTAVITAGGPTTFCQGGSVVLTASGGISYLWSTAATTAAITVTITGIYTVTVTDAGGCSDTASQAVVAWNNTIQLTSAPGTDNQSLCFTSPPEPLANITYATTGATGATFSGLPAWANASWVDSVITIWGTPTGSGVYNYTVTLTGGCGVVEAYGTINVEPLPQGSLSANGPFCESGAGELTWTASAGTGPFTIHYNDGTANRTANNVSSGVPFPVAVTPVTSTTTYTLLQVDDLFCTRIDYFTTGSVTITINALPTALITPDGPTTFCEGGTVTLTASGGISYLWSTTETTEAITVSVSGTYTVTVTDSNGCSDTASIDITVVPTMGEIITNFQTVFCQDAPDYQFVATAANASSITYMMWPPAAGVIDPITGWMNWDPAFHDMAKITVTAQGCGGPAETIIDLTVNPQPSTSTIYHN